MSDVFIVVIDELTLQLYNRPALDLGTGALVELSPAAGEPVQLELPFGNTYTLNEQSALLRGDHHATQFGRSY